jgi:hypothetical protein
MWGLWWTKRHWGRFSPSTSVSPANHSTDLSIIIITRGWHNRPLSGRSVEWTLIPPPTMQIFVCISDEINEWMIQIRVLQFLFSNIVKLFKINQYKEKDFKLLLLLIVLRKIERNTVFGCLGENATRYPARVTANTVSVLSPSSQI